MTLFTLLEEKTELGKELKRTYVVLRPTIISLQSLSENEVSELAWRYFHAIGHVEAPLLARGWSVPVVPAFDEPCGKILKTQIENDRQQKLHDFVRQFPLGSQDPGSSEIMWRTIRDILKTDDFGLDLGLAIVGFLYLKHKAILPWLSEIAESRGFSETSYIKDSQAEAGEVIKLAMFVNVGLKSPQEYHIPAPQLCQNERDSRYIGLLKALNFFHAFCARLF